MADPVISLVLAVSRNGVIGDKNGLPWSLPSDLKRFRKLTMGHPLIMGRATFESIGRPLDGRDNIVLTRRGTIDHDKVYTASSLDDALAKARRFAHDRKVDEIMVIGGGQVFDATRDMAGRVYLTHIDMDVAGDTLFRPLNRHNWVLKSRKDCAAGPDDSAGFSACVYERAGG